MSGAVSASGGFVSQFICPPCVRGCVRLRTICLPIHLSPNSFVSQVLVSQFICLPIHLSPRSCGRGCVRLRGIGFPIHLSPNSFVSQVLCKGLCPPSGDLSPNSFVRLVSGAVSASGRFVSQFIPQTAYCWGTQFYLKMCPPCVRGCVRLPGLCVSHHLSPILCLPCPVSGAVSASLGFVSPISPQTVYCWRSQFSFKRCPAMFRWWCLAFRMSRIHLSPCGNSFVSQSGWWCPALWLSPIHLFALISTHLFPSLAGGVPLSGCLQFICLPLYQLICFPVWLVVSGSSAVSNSFVSPCGNSFPKQFTVGVLNSILKCVRLVSGAVSASGRFVFQFICLPIHLSPRSCVRGCVRLRGICLPIHLSPNSFVSQVLCQGLCPPPGDLFPNSFVSQVLCQGLCPPFRDLSPIICFLSPLCQGLCPPPGDLSPNSFVSQFICLPGPVSGAVSASGGFVSQFICPPCVRGCVRLRTICLPIHLSPNSFVSQVLVSQFICLPGPVAGAVSASGGLVSQFICLPIHLSPRSCVRGCVRLRGICLPIHLSALCQGLCPPPDDLSPNSFPKQLTVGVLNSILRCVRLVSGAVSASLGSVSPIICLPSFVSHVLCQGCVRLPGLCVSHQSPNSLLLAFSILFQAVSGYVQMVVSGSPDVPNSFVPLWQFICLPIWLVVSSSLAVSNSFVCPYLNSFVSQSGWWCPALWLSPIHLSALISTHLFPSLAGGVRLFGCLQFICLPLWQLICLPIWLVVSGFGCLQFICLALWQLICLPVWLVVSGSSAVSVTLVMSGSLAVSN